MNLVCSIGLPDGSLTLVGSIQMKRVLPCDVEPPCRVPEGLVVAVGICDSHSSKVFSSAIFMSNTLFILECELTIVVIDPSNVSCTQVALLS